MIANASNKELYIEFHEYIDNDEVKSAFCYIVGLCAILLEYTCHPTHSGGKRDFRFTNTEAKIPFALIVTKSWLLFYFRKSSVDSGNYNFDILRESFESAHENNTGEWTIKLSSIADVNLLWRILAIS
jgi:hypothetical protein